MANTFSQTKTQSFPNSVEVRKTYTDGEDIETAALSFAKAYTADEYESHIKDDMRMLDSFSPSRPNLLRWYPFRDNCDILEVGAGMGALTGFLSTRAGSVTAIEMMERRAAVTKERCRDCTNVEVIVADMEFFKPQKLYDYVVVVGVLEYAGRFITEKDPHLFFMKRCKSFLKPDGILLLAIENRFGLRYWAGENENHIGLPYVGIAGYKDYDIRTFSKRALSELALGAGFAEQRYYYPFPDYKAPMAVFTDEYLPDALSLAAVAFPAKTHFNQREVFAQITEEGMLGFFADAFLLECSAAKLPDRHAVGAFMRFDAPEMRNCTIIWNDKTVWKEPYDHRADAYIRQAYENYLTLKQRGLEMLPTEYDGHKLIMPFCEQPRADLEFAEALRSGDIGKAKHMLDLLRADVLKSTEVTDGVLHYWYDLGFYNAFWGGQQLRTHRSGMGLLRCVVEGRAFVHFAGQASDFR